MIINMNKEHEMNKEHKKALQKMYDECLNEYIDSGAYIVRKVCDSLCVCYRANNGHENKRYHIKKYNNEYSIRIYSSGELPVSEIVMAVNTLKEVDNNTECEELYAIKNGVKLCAIPNK